MLMKKWRSAPLWRVNIVIWSIVSILFFARALLSLDLVPALSISVFHLTLCLVFTSLLLVGYRRLEQKMGFGVETAGWIIGLSLLVTLIQSISAHYLIQRMGWHNSGLSQLELWLMRVMFFWLIYMVWSLLYFWLRAERAAREHDRKMLEARAEAQRMELQLLRSQLDPHFLFNALNGIATVVQAESPTASSMARELADYLRYSLDHRYDTFVPLSQEIEAMMAYLRIEQTRFSEELHVEITTDDAARKREVPCFLLLPLVENAVKHSFLASEPPWNVTILAESANDLLTIEVTNPGSLSTEPSSRGVGLEILQRRLAIHYPDRHRMLLTEENSTVRARLELRGDPCSA